MPKKKQVIVEEPSYEVECIYAARVTEDEQWEYNIKWGGYSEEENSWEPETNLNGCARMMTEFWEQVGPEHKARAEIYPAGHEVTPSTLWIKRQRAIYEKTQARRKSQRDKFTKAKDSDQEIYVQTVTDESVSDVSDSDEDDMPLSLKVASLRQSAGTKEIVATSNAEGRSVHLKRKRNEYPSPEASNKRVRPTSMSKLFKEVAPDNGLTAENVQSVTVTSKKKVDDVSQRSSSPRDSLFSGGSESEDMPLASKSSTPISHSKVHQQTQPHSTVSTTPPVVLVETQPKEKPKIPLHRERKQNPRIKTLTLPILDTNLGGLSTKTRIYLQSNIAGSSQAKASLPVGDGASASPITVENPTTPLSAIATQEFDAHTWLRDNIMSKEELTRAAANDSQTLPAEHSTTTSQVPRFSKRWRWSGQLAIGDNETGSAELVGNIVITDSTPLDRNAGKLSLEALLPSHVDTICLRHQYALSIIWLALRAFKISQFAVMTSGHSAEENSYEDVVSYMTKHELFSQSPLTIADLEAATMFVFPSTLMDVLDRLSVPAKVRQGKGLVVAIGFKISVPPNRSLRSNWKKNLKVDLPETRTYDCNRAILALDFPESLFSRLSGKQCTILTTSNDGDLPGHDSRALVTILESASGCKIVPLLTGNARFIFIHVAAWGMLHKLPGLVDRRLRRPDVQFYTYGSDASVERKRWGVHEVFPLGGVVTFTPRAIVEDPIGVEQLISKLHEHPLWTCYVVPSVIPMLCKVAAAESGSNYLAKSGIEALCSILLPIEKGQMALTWQPPSRVVHDANGSPKWIDWMIDQGRLLDLRGNDLVQECQKRFQRQQDRSEKDVEAQIVKDLLVMQSELREGYRRFVIITDTTGVSNTSKQAAASTSVSKADIKDGFELTHVKDFVFNDDYFANERA